LALRTVDLDRFFRPRTVAVIGASATAGKTNTTMWRAIRVWGERTGARVVPVHPTHRAIDGVPCVPTIDQVAPLAGAPIDLWPSSS